MRQIFRPILALGLFFGMSVALAAPLGEPKDYELQTKYGCQANGVPVYNKDRVVSDGLGIDEVQFTARAGQNQALTFGAERDYMIWPRTAKGSFNKALNVLARDKSGHYQIVQEIDLGDSQKTKSIVNLTVKDEEGAGRQVHCRIEMAWQKK